jgi:protein TonB
VIQEVENDVKVETQLQSTDIDINTEIAAPAPVKVEAPPPPPPPAPEVEEEIFAVVEDAPRFPGCEDLADKKEREICAQKKMLEFIYANIKYPSIARENGVEGTAVIKFVVDKDGKIKAAEVVRDPGAQLGDEAKRVVEMMNDMPTPWIPGKQRGKAVKVYFNLPVKFKLQ